MTLYQFALTLTKILWSSKICLIQIIYSLIQIIYSSAKVVLLQHITKFNALLKLHPNRYHK